MGIHSGPVNEISDLNEQANLAGAGINIAQRVMDCADAGHIFLSRHVAEDLMEYRAMAHRISHDLGDCESETRTAHPALPTFTPMTLVNPKVPEKLQADQETSRPVRWAAVEQLGCWMVPRSARCASLLILRRAYRKNAICRPTNVARDPPRSTIKCAFQVNNSKQRMFRIA